MNLKIRLCVCVCVCMCMQAICSLGWQSAQTECPLSLFWLAHFTFSFTSLPLWGINKATEFLVLVHFLSSLRGKLSKPGFSFLLFIVLSIGLHNRQVEANGCVHWCPVNFKSWNPQQRSIISVIPVTLVSEAGGLQIWSQPGRFRMNFSQSF